LTPLLNNPLAAYHSLRSSMSVFHRIDDFLLINGLAKKGWPCRKFQENEGNLPSSLLSIAD
jgi:hypothetical protein